jgi:hypothetical protein
MVPSGGGDPPCISSAVVSTCTATGEHGARVLRAGRRLAALERLADGRRLAVDRRFRLVRRFTCALFFREEREVAARFLRFAICCLQSGRAVYQ